MWVAADSILRLTRVPTAGYELRVSRVPAAGSKLWLIPSYGWLRFQRLDKSCGWLRPSADSSSGGWIRAADDTVPRLNQVPAGGYEWRLTPSHGWFEFGQVDTSWGWLRPTAEWSSGGWIRVTADSILRLTRDPAPWYELQLILSYGCLEYYTLIYQVNLRTYSAKYIIFMVCFLPTDFSYHWSRLWLLLQEPWRSLRKLEEASRL